MYYSTKMTDPTIELAEDSSVKMLRVADPEVREVLVPIQEDDTLEEPTTLDVIAELTEEELEEEFNKLSASDKIRCNQWVEFHEHYQKTHGIAGTLSQIICYISDINKPAIPIEIAKEELANVDVDDKQVQIIKMVNKDGKLVNKVKLMSCTEDFQGIRFFFIIVKYRNYHRCSRNQYRLMLHLMFHLLERSIKLCKDVR